MELKTKKPRVFSAKYPQPIHQKVRPRSGVSTQYKKQQIIQNVYNSSQTQNPARASSAKNQFTSRRYTAVYQENDRYFPKQSKQREEMASQILILKQTINKLSEELSHQKGKAQTIKRKNSQYSKAFALQFQNEKQWGSHTVSNHLVSGIKAMYDNLKQKYQKKCKFCDDLIAKVEMTNFLQMHFYIQTLQKNNKELKKKLQSVINSSLQFPVSTQAQKKAKNYHLAQLKFQNEGLVERVKQLQISIKKNMEQSSESTKKTSFLQKLLIEKDNNIHALARTQKQQSTQIKKLSTELQKITQKCNQQEQHHRTTIQTFQQKIKQLQNKYNTQREEIVIQKDQQISTLQRNNMLYQQNIIELKKNNVQLNYQLQNIKEEKLKEKFKPKEQEPHLKTKKTILDIIKKEEVKKQQVVEKGPRKPQRADRRHNEQATKTRKIQLSEILEISQLIRYKMLAHKISIQKFKDLFNKSKEKEYPDQQWAQQFITMQQIIDILTNEPVNLKQQSSFLIARYIIQDVNQQYVYCDSANQNHRQVVKSIIKTLIQKYPFLQGQAIDQDFKKTIQQYGQNLQSSLRTLYKDGTVSKNKFLSLLKSLGIQISVDLQEYMVGKMAIHSNDINQLPYEVLF